VRLRVIEATPGSDEARGCDHDKNEAAEHKSKTVIPPSQFIFARMLSVFSTVFDRAQNTSMHLLHEAKRSGQIKSFILPYLGQLDRELPNPPANLVRREEAHAYPTDFNAMPDEWIERLSLRREQLTLCLSRAYIPDLIREAGVGEKGCHAD
jgi:NTE family protein